MNQSTPEIVSFIIDGYTVAVDLEDSDLAEFKWQPEISEHGVYFSRPLKARETTLRMPGVKPLKVKLHRIILARKLGHSLPMDKVADHRDTDTLNNRRSNLRLATHAQNSQNARRMNRNTSGYKGVYWDKTHQNWVARISIDKKQVTLGRYQTPELAYEAYCKAAKEHFGEFARLE